MVEFIEQHTTGIYLFLIHAFYFSGFLFSLHALMNCRSPQGTIAWILSLIFFPFLGIPMYLIFGRNKFYGYVESLRSVSEEFLASTENCLKEFYISHDKSSLKIRKEYKVLEQLAEMPFTSGNQLKLLINGEKTFAEMFKAIEQAENYILVQFYIVNNDEIGNKFKQKLIEKAVQGVKVYFLFDEIGCSSLPQKYVDDLNKYENIEIQLSFIKDWYWACRQLPELTWDNVQGNNSGSNVLVAPTGPADKNDNGILLFMEIIRMAKKRLWISTPYFVPDPSIVDALKLAALRGVDVRILIPHKAEEKLPHLAAYSYLPEVKESGIKIFRYTKGFVHQKVVLVDNDLACIGSANFDNRSMRLNFEISILSENQNFAKQVEDMLLADFKESITFKDNDYWERNFWFRVLVNLIRLFAPVL